MDRLFQKSKIHSNSDYVEYVNVYVITALSALLYISHGIVFFIHAYNHLLIVTQALSIFICLAAFLANKHISPRVSVIIMVVLISMSINIWAYCTDGGNDMRWYAVLALCPLYFFSVVKMKDKVILTLLVLFAFLSASIISYYHEGLVKMSNLPLYSTVSSFVIIVSIALEIIFYKYVNYRRDNELKRSETILNNIECGIIIVDSETHRLLDINSVAERMYGGAKETVIGEKCHNLVCTTEEGRCPITDLHQDQNRVERVFLRSDGTTVPIIKSVARIWYNDRPALLESFTDISDLKEAENKLRLLEITERANRAKSEFLSRMSHEMRTPMNAIIGMAKIAEGTEDVARLKYCLSTIETSSSHLLGIINDVLDMSKIESGKFELDTTSFGVEKILMKVCNLMLDQAERKGIEIRIFINVDTTVQYLGDELRLTQVIANLMSNAVKFTPDGGEIRLSVDEVKNSEREHVLRFAVADTGIGMTGDQIGRLFNAFEQADGSITRLYGGTGLGLAISRSIVEKMNGRIWVESEPGAGSNFIFEVSLGSAPEAENIPGITARALVYEPDGELRRYFVSAAGRLGISVDEAESFDDVFLRVNEASLPYDAVFIDYAAPDSTGLEAIGRIAPEFMRSSVVLMTALSTWTGIESAAREAGFTRFVPRPVFPSALVDAIIEIRCKNSDFYPKPAPVETTPDLSGLKLLLAEDVEINREIFVALLGDTGIEIDIAENGMEAVKMVEAHPEGYDVIIMDIQMPGMNGYEATKIIRAMDAAWVKTVPIIAMTADAFNEDIERCLACGMNDHLKKPIELEIVIEKLMFYCGRAALH